MKSIFISLLLLLVFPLQTSLAETQTSKTNTQVPILWKLDTKPTSWLFGTIHLPDPRVNKLPYPAKVIFDQSDVVLTEIPMETADIAAIANMMKRRDGKSLKSILPEDLYQRLEKHFKSFSLPILLFNDMKLWAIYASLPMLPTQTEHPTSIALDKHIYQQAKRDGKITGGLESAIEQASYFDRFTHEEQITLLRETLDTIEADKEREKGTIELMLEWYLSGGKTHLTEFMEDITPISNDKALEQKVADILLTERNEIMAKRIVSSLENHPNKSHFIAIGAGHLSEEANVPFYLEKLGIKAEKVY